MNPPISPRLVLGLLIPGLVLTAALLALFGYAAWNIVSRRYLDRCVNLPHRDQLTTHHASLIFGVSLAMAFLGGYSDWKCSLLSFTANQFKFVRQQLSFMFSSCIFFCMALNVPLVVVYKISGQAMEKYYVAGTILICLICNVPPYASGNLGHVLIPTKTCWYSSADSEVRFRWLVGTQTSWMIIMAGGEVVAFLIIIGYLVTHEVRLSLPACYAFPPATSLCTHWGHLFLRGAGTTILKFRNIILRIEMCSQAFTPLVSCLLSVTAGVVDLYESREYKMEALESKLDSELMLVAMASCAGRPLIYGLLAATDPSFIRALYALRHPDAEDRNTVLPPHRLPFHHC
ncbi:hypothetical protein B0H14DRAFT_3140304 [Mycena olivaceomarginata]|nr:hypothetical protein B0H14DRAFT_3140304 [Mycena olivaceomarginata]